MRNEEDEDEAEEEEEEETDVSVVEWGEGVWVVEEGEAEMWPDNEGGVPLHILWTTVLRRFFVSTPLPRSAFLLLEF